MKLNLPNKIPMPGSELKSFRLMLGMSQHQFGSELGLKFPQIQISDLERGRRIISERLRKSIERWMENVNMEGENVANNR